MFLCPDHSVRSMLISHSTYTCRKSRSVLSQVVYERPVDDEVYKLGEDQEDV